MQAYRRETKVQANGTVIIQNIPLQAGEIVEVIILTREAAPSEPGYQLRGRPVTYHQPFEPVAESDWSALS